MDIIVISRDRPELLEQTIRSMRENAADWSKHRLVVVFDGTQVEMDRMHPFNPREGQSWPMRGQDLGHTVIQTGEQLGVGGAKNFGAAWLSRGKASSDLLMFSDGDMYYLPGWDTALEKAINGPPSDYQVWQVGGWRHPFHALGDKFYTAGTFNTKTKAARTQVQLYQVDAATGNCFVIRWSDWLMYGPFDANAIGPGQSEDYALSQRIKAGGGIVATLDPPVAIHCGLINSSGEPATGWREMEVMVTQQLAQLPKSLRDEILLIRPLEVPSVPASVEGGTAYSSGSELASGRQRLLDMAAPSASSERLWDRNRVQTDEVCFIPQDQQAGVNPSGFGMGVRSDSNDGSRAVRSASLRRTRLPEPGSSVYGEPWRQHARYVPEGPREGEASTTGCSNDPRGIRAAKMGLETGRVRTLSNQVGGERAANPCDLGRQQVDDDLVSLADRLNDAAVEMGMMEPLRPLTVPLTVPMSFIPKVFIPKVGLNIGSGQRPFKTTPATYWMNIDAQSVSPDRVPDLVCDVGREQLPIIDGAADYVVLHQVLEHFGCGESAPMLLECWRVLRSGGSLIITVPDMRKLAARWLGGEMDDQLYMTNVYGAYMGDEADRHRWGFSAGSLFSYVHGVLPSDAEPHVFDWREIPGASIARDWWVAAAEFVKR